MKTSVANPDPVLFLPLDPGTGMGNKSGSKVPESGMNISDHFSKSLETSFWEKILKNLRCGSGIRNLLGSGMEKIRSGIRDKHPGSATLMKTSKNLFVFKVPRQRFPMGGNHVPL
jgi:hypothetical protein